CPCDKCEQWRLAHDPEYRAAAEHERDHKHHFHALIMVGLDRDPIKIHHTEALDTVEAAHGQIAESLRDLKKVFPMAAEGCDSFLASQPRVGGITIANSAFVVAPCCEGAGDCRAQLDIIADVVIAEYEGRHNRQ